jgi:hypothetical protein
MQLKSVSAAVALLIAAGAASAWTTDDFTSHTVVYDETTSFGFLAGSYTAGGGAAGFSWTVPDAAQVASFGPLESVTIALPSFTITANAGWTLSGISAFLGNLSFTQVGGATTQIKISADLSVDGSAAVSLQDDVNWATTSGGTGYSTGYFGETFGPIPAGFSTLSVTNASIVLSASGGVFSSIAAQPQNTLQINLVAVPVPEPETYAMMLAGLAALGWMASRRNNRA